MHLASIYVTILFAFTAAMPAGVSELVDEADSKSVGSNAVWVRFPPPAHKNIPEILTRASGIFLNLMFYGNYIDHSDTAVKKEK